MIRQNNSSVTSDAGDTSTIADWLSFSQTRNLEKMYKRLDTKKRQKFRYNVVSVQQAASRI